jgi:uncharacterized protein (TIGR02722 family)
MERACPWTEIVCNQNQYRQTKGDDDMILFFRALMLTMVLSLVACRSARYVENRDDQMVNVGQINVQDWESSAEQMLQSLLNSGVLGGHGDERKVLMVSHVENKTRQHIDTDMLTKKIRIGLMRSGKAITTSYVKMGGPEDGAPDRVRELRTNDEFNQNKVPTKGQMVAPEYSLSGKIIQLDAASGKTKQSTFAFQLSLTNLKTGLAEWEDEVSVTKQGSKAAIGW